MQGEVLIMKGKNRLIATAVLSVTAVLLAVMAIYAFMTPVESVKNVVDEIVIQKGELEHYAKLKNESIYGRMASLDYYPIGITESIEGVYSYSVNPEKRGEYRMIVKTTYYVQEGRDKIQIWQETLNEEHGDFAGKVSIPVTLNFAEMNNRLYAVREGTALPRLTGVTEIIFTANIENESFNHTIKLNEGSSLYSFSDESKMTRKVYSTKEVIENSFGGVSVSNARILYTAMAIFAAIPIAVINRDLTRREKKNPYIVKGRREGEKIILESEEDLKKVFAMSDSPVVRTETDGVTVYSIVTDGVVYEYREG